MPKHSRWFRKWQVRPTPRPAADARTAFRPALTRLEDRSTPAKLTTAGTTLQVVLDTKDEVVSFSTAKAGEVGLASTKTIVLDGTTKTSPVTLTGYTSFVVTDTETNTAVVFNDSAADYQAAFDVTLDSTPATVAVTFNGTSSFGANSLSVVATGNVLVASKAAIKSTDGDITLDGNSTAGNGKGTFNGVDCVGDVSTSGIGSITVKGQGGDAGGEGVVLTGTLTTSGSGSLSVTGKGGGGTATDHGVDVSGSNASVSAGGSGAVSLDGQGGGKGGKGVVVTGKVSAADGGVSVTGKGGSGSSADTGADFLGSVSTSGSGSISVNGQGGGKGGKGVSVTGTLSASGVGYVYLVGKGGSGGTGANTGVDVSGSSAGLSTKKNAIAVYGTGGDGGGASPGISVSGGAVISAASVFGTVTLSGTAGASTQSNNQGVRVTGTGTQVKTDNADVDLTGTGGGSGSSSTGNDGVLVSAGANVTAGGDGWVYVTGYGGSAGSGNAGVRVTDTNSAVETAGGTMFVTGYGGSTGSKSYGVVVSAGGKVDTAVTGGLSVTGYGGSAGSNADGVMVDGAGSQLTTAGGNLSVTGYGGGDSFGSGNDGVVVTSGGKVTAGGSGAGSVSGSGGQGLFNDGVFVDGGSGFSFSYIQTSGADLTVTGAGSGYGYDLQMYSDSFLISGGTGNLTVYADTADLDYFATLQAGSSGLRTLNFLTRTAGTKIALGGSDVFTGTRTLGLTNNELSTFVSAKLNIGDANAGAVSVVSDVSLYDPSNVRLTSGGDIAFSGGGFDTSGGSLLLVPGSGQGVTVADTGIDVTANALSFNSTSNLKIAIDGTTAGSQYTQLTVLGKVNLTGLELALSGSYTPVAGDSFTVISASSLSGTFDGLPDGTLFTYKGVSLRVKYSTVDVTLVVNQLPTGVTTGGPYTVDEGSPLTLTATATDPNGDKLTYSWDVNGDGVFGDEAYGSTADNGKTLKFTAAQLTKLGLGDGPKTVSKLAVRVNDGGGWVTSPLSTLTVNNVPPTTTLSGPTASAEAQTVTFGGTFTDPVADGPFTYAWSVAASNGQVVTGASGTVKTAGAVPDFSFTPDDSGTYVVTLVVTDKDGGAVPVKSTLTVANLPPTITQLVVPSTGTGGVSVPVSAAATDPAGANDPLTYTWAVLKNGVPYTGGVGANFAFVPDAVGTYTVTLTVTDGDGGSATASRTVAVNTSILPPPGFDPNAVQPRYAVAAGGIVRLYNPDGEIAEVQPFPGYTGEITVALADLNGDRVPELVVGAGTGGGPHVKVFDGASGNLMASFYAFDPGFHGGVFVAAGGGRIAVGAGPGAGPHVKVFDPLGNELQSFFAYDQNFHGGVHVALADLNGDGVLDVVTGTASGAPHVKVFAGGSLAELASFYAFDPGFQGGVFVAAGGGRIAVGAGAGGSPHVKVLTPTGGELQSFYAFGSGTAGGVRVALTDVNGDGALDLLAGTGPAASPGVRAFSLPDLSELVSIFPGDPLTPNPFVPFRGVFVS